MDYNSAAEYFVRCTPIEYVVPILVLPLAKVIQW